MAVLDEIMRLIEQPRESLAVEIKPWLDLDNSDHQAKIVKTAIALRNNNGGYMIFGFDNSLKPSANPPADSVAAYHPDKVQRLISRFSSDPFEVGIEYPEKDGIKYPVLIIPGGVKSVVASKIDLKSADGTTLLITAHDVYVRSLISNNTPSTTKAGWRDWPALGQIHFDNRETDIGNFLRRHLGSGALDTLRAALLTGSEPPPLSNEEKTQAFFQTSSQRFGEITAERALTLPDHGSWQAALVINGQIPPHKANKAFLRLVDNSNPQYTGWPIWFNTERFSDQTSHPFVHDHVWETILASLEADPHDHIDFMRLDPKGRFFIRRAYEDDTGGANRKPAPLKGLDFGLAILRTAEVIGVALAFAKAMGCDPETTSLSFLFGWNRLKGRELVSWANPGRRLSGTRKAYQDEVQAYIEVPLNMPLSRLGDVTKQLIDPLFEVFDGFEINESVVNDLASRLVNRTL